MNLLAYVAQTAGEQQLDLRVYIFGVGLNLEAPRLNLGGNLLQSGRQPFQFVAGEQSDALEHRDVGQRPLDIVAGQPQVEFAVVAHGVGFDVCVGLEALVPEFSCHIGMLRFFG